MVMLGWTSGYDSENYCHTLINRYKNLSCLWASWSTDEDMEGQRQSLNVTVPREKLLSKQINTLALQCLYSNRLDIRLVDITAVQERTAKKWSTQIDLHLQCRDAGQFA